MTNLKIANQQEKLAIDKISDAMYATLVEHTRDTGLGLSSIAMLLAKTLLEVSDDKNAALASFREHGIPIIEQTILGSIERKSEHTVN